MTSTVTTATLSTVSTALFASLGLILALTLLVLLVNKEILSNSTHPVAKTLRRALNIAIVPMVMAFAFIAVINVMQAIG
jgi:uncharacterized membrane protein YesL